MWWERAPDTRLFLLAAVLLDVVHGKDTSPTVCPGTWQSYETHHDMPAQHICPVKTSKRQREGDAMLQNN